LIYLRGIQSADDIPFITWYQIVTGARARHERATEFVASLRARLEQDVRALPNDTDGRVARLGRA
jgi:hypothetical protein